MDEKKERSVTRAEWFSGVALLMSAATTIFYLGVVWGDVQDHERRLARQEEKSDITAARVERIDANVTFLTELAREQRGGHP